MILTWPKHRGMQTKPGSRVSVSSIQPTENLILPTLRMYNVNPSFVAELLSDAQQASP